MLFYSPFMLQAITEILHFRSTKNHVATVVSVMPINANYEKYACIKLLLTMSQFLNTFLGTKFVILFRTLKRVGGAQKFLMLFVYVR